MDSGILTYEVVRFKPFRTRKEQNLMPRLYDADGNRYTITWNDERFQSGIVVTKGLMKWKMVPLLSSHIGQSPRFTLLPQATRCTVPHPRRSHHLTKKAVATQSLAPSPQIQSGICLAYSLLFSSLSAHVRAGCSRRP
jgi:hypothetical protein